MSEELLEYYERELNYLRQMGGDFARRYPRVASRLLLTGDSCEDPHVERLLEGFAFMAARVHRRIDDDFPEISESLLNMIYPAYLRPIPSMTIVECLSDPGQGKKTAGTKIPRGSAMVTKATVDGMPCRFESAYEVELWPFSVVEAEWRQVERLQYPVRASGEVQAVTAARLKLKCFQDVEFEGLPLSTLRFHLAGDASVVYNLYEMISANCIEIILRDPKNRTRTISLEPGQIRMVGFEKDEAVIPHERRSAEGHRLLQEYFALPEKFLFFDLSGLEALGETGFGDEAEIIFLFSRFERSDRQQVMELGVSARTFRLGCTPVINLFPQTAEPILLTQTKHEYTVIPDGRHAAMMEVFSIDEVIAANPKLRQSVTLEPVNAHRYETREQKDTAYWTATRNVSQLGEREPSVLTISVVDLNGQLKSPDADVLTVRTTCSNFDLPSRFNFGTTESDMEAVGHAAAKVVNVLRRPTASADPPQGKGQVWRLVSLLSLNYLSLTEDGKTALQEILRLHNFTDSQHLENHIGSIQKMTSGPHFALVLSDYGLVPARGTEVHLELDEQQFVGGGVYLFAAVLDRFLAGYASINSFSQLSVRTNLRKEVMRTWPPRAGTKVLL
ncbi:type VI secretion system baseplate subunit TssF [Granulicella tundricola]|uniref:Type VI secretion protein, VC_A0110 family n=1 Tax=Granulicella tundricola (strain ATCC BAA-1859 / DSM 23138 / MP5ACTX9) TaxID=1198114 RepID=E8X5R1_GRATM|nr:type VI secretion system baseplate subunit TssF [Granulicella tundricola]ADW70795.1 type VI secretion protein, VC_A0110 family [Granulicella tundricola MP5ACTX9]